MSLLLAPIRSYRSRQLITGFNSWQAHSSKLNQPHVVLQRVACSQTRHLVVSLPRARPWNARPSSAASQLAQVSSQTIATFSSQSSTKASPEAMAENGSYWEAGIEDGIRSLWFSETNDEESAILPKMGQMMRWFQKSHEFDQLCLKLFETTLEGIRTTNPSPKALIQTANPQTPEDWLALLLILDQMPRNCYRGDSASVVFTVFDPLARAVAQKAIALGIPDSPDIKYYASRRVWFYLPLMHSEDLAAHDQALAEYERMRDEFLSLVSSSSENALTAREAKCRQVLAADKEHLEKLMNSNLDFEIKHRDIIVRFGRYPHRNGPLGREMTPEEQQYLDNGGETFGSSG